MNDRQRMQRTRAWAHPLRVIPSVGFVLALLVAASLANAAAPTLPADVRTASNAVGFEQTIRTFVQGQFHKIESANEDIAQVTAAREALLAELANTTPPPSASFMSFYAQEVNNAVKTLLKHKDIRVRLNVAIIVAKVAEKCNNGALAPAAIALLSDNHSAVVLWAARAAKFTLYDELTGHQKANQKSVLIPALSGAVKQFAGDGAIAQAAFEALAIPIPAGAPDKVWLAAVGVVVPEIQDLLAWRVGLYKAAVPSEPSADSVATTFLTLGKVYAAETDAAKLQTVQSALDLLNLGVARLAVAAGEEVPEMKVMITKVASSLAVVGINTKNDTLRDTATTVRNLRPSSQLSEFQAAIRALSQPFISAFPNLKPSPTIDPFTPPAAPATTRSK